MTMTRIEVLHWSDAHKDHIVWKSNNVFVHTLCGKRYRIQSQCVVPLSYQCPSLTIHEMVAHEKWREFNWCKVCFSKKRFDEEWRWEDES